MRKSIRDSLRLRRQCHFVVPHKSAPGKRRARLSKERLLIGQGRSTGMNDAIRKGILRPAWPASLGVSIALLTCAFLGFTFLSEGAQAAQSHDSEKSAIHPDLDIASFQWNGMQWRVPKRFMPRMDQNHSGISLSLRWRDDDVFVPADKSSEGAHLSIYISPAEHDLPSLASSGLKLKRIPLLASARFDGLDYLGSISSAHFWNVRSVPGTYVTCMTIRDDRLVAPDIAADALSQSYKCYVYLRLPHGTLAHVTAWGVLMPAVAQAITSVSKELNSYIGGGS